MTVSDQIKILDRKIKQNEAQYDLDRKQLRYLHGLLETWINMNIWLVKIYIINQVLLNKQNLIIKSGSKRVN